MVENFLENVFRKFSTFLENAWKMVENGFKVENVFHFQKTWKIFHNFLENFLPFPGKFSGKRFLENFLKIFLENVF